MDSYGKSPFCLIFGLAAGVIGFYIIILGTSLCGIGLTMDGASYVSCARSLLDGQGFYAFDERPYIHWPPLFPIILAGAGLFGADPVDILPWFHALVFGLIILGFHHILQKNLKSPFWVVWGTLLALLSSPIILLCTCAYSEPLFILLWGAYLYYLHAFLNKEKKACFVLACLFGSLCCLQRYAGVILPVAGAVLVMAGLPHFAVGKRVKHAVILCMAAYLPLGLWLMRNFAVSSRFAGFKSGGGGRWLDLLESHRQVVMTWIFPSHQEFFWISLVSALGICSVILFWSVNRIKIRHVLSAQNLRTMPGVVGICVAFYWLFILIAEWFSYDVDNNPYRFLTVMQLAFYFLAIAWIDKVMASATTSRFSRPILIITALVAVFWMSGLWGHTSGLIKHANKNEQGLSLFNYEGQGKGRIPDDQKDRLALSAWIDSLPENCPIYSNAAPYLYGLYGVKSMWAPAKAERSMVFAKGVLGWRKPCAFFRFDLLNSPDYKGLLVLEHVMDFPEGQAYIIHPKAP